MLLVTARSPGDAMDAERVVVQWCLESFNRRGGGGGGGRAGGGGGRVHAGADGLSEFEVPPL